MRSSDLAVDELRATECERTRQWISAALDGELSQFQVVLLDRHVQRCHACRSFEERSTAVTSAIRNARAERTLGPVHLPARRRSTWRAPAAALRVGSAAAMVACFVSVGLLAAPEGHRLTDEHVLIASPLQRPSGTSDLVVGVRRPSLARGEYQAIAFGSGGIGAYKPPLAPAP